MDIPVYYSSVDKTVGLFHFLAMVSTDFMEPSYSFSANVFISLEYIPRFRIAEFFS